MKKDNFYTLAKEWFCVADDDLLFAKAGFKESNIARNACFMCQQIAEKYLKGYLVRRGIEPERIHILSVLLTECIKLDKTFSEIEEECKSLDRFYQPARYPNGIELDFKKELAEKAFDAAEKIIKFIKNKI